MDYIYYDVAGHYFGIALSDEDLLGSLTQYEPFLVGATIPEDAAPVFLLREATVEPFPTVALTVETSQDDDGSQIVVGHLADGRSYFEFCLAGKRSARLLTDTNYREATVWLEENALFGLNNALMVMYSLATACLGTALFHSSVVSHRGRGYMFLGKSGTGKSTHSSLWLKHIEGTELVNDDNPVVRVTDDGHATVYGSPWSGKTPCYRNVGLPVGAIVSLSQAPYNRIAPLRGIAAYAALVPSISGKRWDKRMADGLHATENLLAQHVGVWHLECLPDEAAARLCQTTVEQ